MNGRKITFLLLFSALFITMLVFAGIAQNGFAYDDFIAIEANDALATHISPFYFAAHPESAWASKPADGGGIYRPLGVWLTAIQVHVFGPNPFYFHLMSLLLHFANVFLLFLLVRELFHNNWMAFAVSLAFGIHPVVTEPVAWAMQQTTLWAMLFGLLAFMCVLAKSKHPAWPAIVTVFALMSLAVFSKEQIIGLPVVIAAVIFIFYKDRFRKSLWLIGAAFGASLLYVFVRIFAVGTLVQQSSLLGGSYKNAFLTMIRALANYIKLSFIPYPLTVNYDSFGISADFFEPAVVASLLLILGVCAVAAFFYRRRTERWAGGVFLGIIWFFVMLAPVNNIIAPMFQIMNERFLYFGLPGILIAFFSIVILLRRFPISRHHMRFKIPQILPLSLILLTIGFSFLTYKRLGEWKNDELLWKSEVRRVPGDVRNQRNYAIALDRRGDKKALEHYEKAVLLARGTDELSEKILLGWGYLRNGLPEESRLLIEGEYKKSGEDKRLSFLYGQILLQQEDYANASGVYSKLLALYPSNNELFMFAFLSAALADDVPELNALLDVRGQKDIQRIFIPIVEARRKMHGGLWSEASEQFLAAVDNYGSASPFVILWLAESLEKSDRASAAAQMYKLAYKAPGTTIDASRGLARLRKNQ